jgi:hypothetical protein
MRRAESVEGTVGAYYEGRVAGNINLISDSNRVPSEFTARRLYPTTYS